MAHPFGTTALGQDLFSRILQGARLSFIFGFWVLIFGFIPGTVLGIVSGYFGRWVDYLHPALRRSLDVLSQLPILLTVIAAVGPGLKAVIVVIAISAIFGGSRLMRAVSLVEKNKEYIFAARVDGSRARSIVWRTSSRTSCPTFSSASAACSPSPCLPRRC